MSQPNNFQYVHVMQNDYDAEFIKCTLYDGNTPYMVLCPKDSITVKCQLPDGREIESGVESTDKNIITFKVIEKMTQVKGNILAALSLFDTNGRKSPFPFLIKVARALEGVTDDDIMYGKLAGYYANLSKSYAVGTDNEVRDGDVTDNSRYYCEKAARHANEAGETAVNAKDGELAAARHASNAAESARQSAESARQSGKSADNAKKTEQSIDSKSAAALSAMTEKEKNAKKYADLSKSYAVGTGNEIRDGDAADNSRHYYELQNKVITIAINNLETRIETLEKELAVLKETVNGNPSGSSTDTAQWKFSYSGGQNFLTGEGSQNFITSDNSIEIVSQTNTNLYGTDKVEIAGRKICITGNNNGGIVLSGNVYVNGKLLT